MHITFNCIFLHQTAHAVSKTTSYLATAGAAVLVYNLLPAYLAEDCQLVSITGHRRLCSSDTDTCLCVANQHTCIRVLNL